ncbi:Myosin heavy chain-related protein [Raphanus sativus]|nr:Myosin heavy chain-related protein [Raphanus sativus]
MGFSQAIRLNLSSYSSLSPCHQTSVNQKQKTLVAFKGKRRSLLNVKSVLNNTRPSFNDNGTAEPSKVLLDKLFARTQELEGQTSQNSVYPPPDEPLSYSSSLESELQAALMALLKREEDLHDAERKVLSEKKKLNRAKEGLEKRERVIAEASSKHESLQEELKRANVELASQAREIEELKHKLRERDEELAAMRSSLTFKERELDRMRVEISIKSKEVSVASFEFENKSQLLSQANEIVKRQEDEINLLQRALKEKEEELEVSIAAKKLEGEKLRETEASLRKQTEEWLVAQVEVSKLQEVTVKRLGEANETMEDFRRVKKLLTDVRFELVSSREALLSSRAQMGEKELEVESERVKLRVAEAKNFALEREISLQKELLEELREELKKERSLLEKAMLDISTIQDELDKKTNEFQVSQSLLQEKESSLVEAKLEIQHLKSEQASLELLLQEKDEELTEARNKLEEVNREVTELKMLMINREDELTQAAELLKEKDVHLHRIEDELGSSEMRVSEAEMVVERIAELTSRLVMSTTKDLISVEALEKQPRVDYGMENKRLVMELNFTRENLRLKEMEVLAAQRALTFKDEEINVVMGRLEAKERELKKLKEETDSDSEDLKMLYALAQERIEGKTMGDLAIEKLQLEAAQLEVEAATSALQKLAEMSTELLTQADMSIIDADSSFVVIPDDEVNQQENSCIDEVKTEVGRLWSLTEKLLENAGMR